jgi:hypothetical protein
LFFSPNAKESLRLYADVDHRFKLIKEMLTEEDYIVMQESEQIHYDMEEFESKHKTKSFTDLQLHEIKEILMFCNSQYADILYEEEEDEAAKRHY